MNAFNETYNTYKKSPTKEITKTILTTTTVNGKREAEIDIEKSKKKKIKTSKDSDSESDFDFDSYEALGKALKDDSQSLSSRPKRNSSVQRRKLVISDDEDEAQFDDSKSDKMESEEEYDGRYSDEEELYA